MLQKIFEANPIALARQLRDQWNEFLDDYAGRRLSAGPGIRLNRTWGAGTTISATVSPGGGGGGGAAGYIGPFAVEATAMSGKTITEIKIYNSADPDSEYCGRTDVVEFIPATTIQGPFGPYVCLSLVYENNKYSCTFVTNTYGDIKSSARVWPLASIENGRIVQMWYGGMIYWRSRFLVSFGRGDAG